MLKSYKKNIFCLESLWNKDIEQKLSVLPLLEITAKINDIKFCHLTCNPLAEFKFGCVNHNGNQKTKQARKANLIQKTGMNH